MRRLTVSPVALLLAAITAPVAAQAGQGAFTNVTASLDTIVRSDGAVHLMSHYWQITLATDQAFPLHAVKSDCVGQIRVVGETPVAASGACFSEAMDGHGFTMWWQMTEAGTSECPDMCGKWGLYGGYGRFAGGTGSGTWKRGGAFPDGSATGTWMGTVTMKE